MYKTKHILDTMTLVWFKDLSLVAMWEGYDGEWGTKKISNQPKFDWDRIHLHFPQIGVAGFPGAAIETFHSGISKWKPKKSIQSLGSKIHRVSNEGPWSAPLQTWFGVHSFLCVDGFCLGSIYDQINLDANIYQSEQLLTQVSCIYAYAFQVNCWHMWLNLLPMRKRVTQWGTKCPSWSCPTWSHRGRKWSHSATSIWWPQLQQTGPVWDAPDFMDSKKHTGQK